MSFNLPSPFISFLPPEIVATKIDLKFAASFNTDSRKHIVYLTGKVNTIECHGEAVAIVGIEQTATRKLVAAPDRVTRVYSSEIWCIIATSIWVFKELAEVIEVKTSAEPVPTRKAILRIWPACRA
jgi:hypothetical protein